MIPAEQAAAYDQEAACDGEGAAVQNESRKLLSHVNEIYTFISKNLHPSRELYTLTAPPVARMERARNAGRLALYGVALLAISLPIIVVLCLIHARIRDEEAAEGYIAPHETAAAG